MTNSYAASIDAGRRSARRPSIGAGAAPQTDRQVRVFRPVKIRVGKEIEDARRDQRPMRLDDLAQPQGFMTVQSCRDVRPLDMVEYDLQTTGLARQRADEKTALLARLDAKARSPFELLLRQVN